MGRSSFDPTETFVYLTPGQRSVLAAYAAMKRLPPSGISFDLWDELRRARTDAISFRDFGRLVDAFGGELLADIREAAAP